jgi:uroporphyrinogen decarboxylase
MKKETMTLRERVVNVLNHKPVDRMPIDLGMHYSTGISAFGYYNLREYLGLDTDNIYIVDPTQFLARVDKDILERFHCDCITLHPGWLTTQKFNPRGEFNFLYPGNVRLERNSANDWLISSKGGNEHGFMRMPAGGYFFDTVKPGPIYFDERTQDDFLKAYASEAERVYKETDYATFYIGFGGYFGMDEEWLCRTITDPDIIMEENKKAVDNDIKFVGKIIDYMGKYIQGVCMAADLGTQKGPFISRPKYEQLSAPYLKEFCRFVHKNSDMKVFMHSCGSIKPIIPVYIDCGVDILNPVQVSADNMDPSDLKKEFGEKIVFWGGGCNTQEVLNKGTKEDVKKNVKQLVNILKPGSGFVFNQVHNIMGDVPPENVVTMLETAYESSFY